MNCSSNWCFKSIGGIFKQSDVLVSNVYKKDLFFCGWVMSKMSGFDFISPFVSA